jgi:hypothetical protein
VLLGADRLDDLAALVERLADCGRDDARADLRGAWLALALAVARPDEVGARRRAFAAELEQGGVRTPQIGAVLGRAAVLASDPGEARAIGALAARVLGE